MKKLKMSDSEKEELIIKLTKLHGQALNFIKTMKDKNTERTCGEEELKEFEHTTSQLENYIEDVKDGTEPYTTYEEWCTILGDIILDDDNFVVEKDGFEW